MLENDLTYLIEKFSQLPQVEAIALGGSHSNQMNDSLSDYDLYVYVSETIPATERDNIFRETCSYMETGNQFWELEDDGILNCGTEIEIIYRDLNWLENELNRVVFEHQASTGYSTCFWSNLLNCRVIYDPTEKLKELKERFSVPYPAELKTNIVAKNLPLLTDSMPAYPKQIAKALKRRDKISVHHRVTEYLASYFDILFAINELPHPGEKRLVSYTDQYCKSIPEHFDENISNILTMAGHCDDQLLDELKVANKELQAIL